VDVKYKFATLTSSFELYNKDTPSFAAGRMSLIFLKLVLLFTRYIQNLYSLNSGTQNGNIAKGLDCVLNKGIVRYQHTIV